MRQAELMDAGLELFLSTGYEKTTVQDIVKKVSVAQGTFYYYFTSKEALLEAIYARYAKNMVIHIQSDVTALEKLQLLINHFYKLCYDGEPGLLAAVLYREKQGELINKVWRQLHLIAAPLFRAILEQGNQEGVTQVTHVDETLAFFAGIIAALLEASSPLEFGHESDPSIIKNKLAIAEKLIATLFGTPPGKIHFLRE